MAIKHNYPQSLEDSLCLTGEELYRRCEDAARIALRGDEPTTRADCAADIFGDAIALCAADRKPRTGRPAQVLDYIAGTEARIARGLVTLSSEDRAESFYPRRTDARVSFSALRRDAANWRDRNDIRRSNAEMTEGAKRAKRVVEDAPTLVNGYVTAEDAAEEDAATSRRCAVLACRALGLAPGSQTEPSDAAIVFYAYARHAADSVIAAELGLAPDALRKRLSRGAADVRQGRNSATLLLALMDSTAPFQIPRKTARDIFTTVENRPRSSAKNPHRIPAGSVLIALSDDSTEAKGASSILTLSRGPVAGRRATVELDSDGHTVIGWAPMPATPRGWREGTAQGEEPERPNDARQARESCRVSKLSPAEMAAPEELTDEDISKSLRRLGGALGGMRGRMPKNATGRTAGKPSEKYATRTVRLGASAGQG